MKYKISWCYYRW